MSFSLLLVNNIPTHHQIPLAQNLYNLLGDNFRFACYKPVSSDRLAVGWQDVGKDVPWMIRAWESEKTREEYDYWLDTSDVVIGFPENWESIKKRLSENKLCLPASERPLKPSNALWGFPPLQRRKAWIRHILSYYRGRWQRIQRWRGIDSHYCHLLTIGAYCPWDVRRLGVFRDRMWSYGYFVEVPANPPKVRLEQPVQILWVGRMLDWKRVDILIKACNTLYKKKLNFHLTIIGDGPESSSILQLIGDLGLHEKVSLRQPIPPHDIRTAMQSAHIYVLSSTHEEGWGAVIGEAMAEGCAVVASDGAGSAPMLIENGVSGYIFPVDDVDCLAKYLEELIRSPENTYRMGLEGWRNMNSTWSPKVAADRLLELSKGLLGQGKTPYYIEGPCSPAKFYKPNTFFGRAK